MKTIRFFALVFLFCIAFMKAQVSNPEVYDNTLQNIFSNLEKNKIPNGLLLDAAIEYADLKKYDGSLPDSSYTNSKLILDVYNTMVMSRMSANAYIPKTSEAFINEWKAAQELDVIPLGGVLYKYAKFSDATNHNAQNSGDPGTVSILNNQIYDKYVNGIWQNPYQENFVFAVSPAVASSNKFKFKIYLPANLFITNQDSQIQQIEYRLAENEPYKILSKDQFINVNYTALGTYIWTFKITLAGGEVLYSHTKFNVDGNLDVYRDDSSSLNSLTSSTNNLSQYHKKLIDPYLVSVAGVPIYKGKATVYYRLAPGHQKITKPFIISEGFDMGVVVAPGREAGLQNIEGFFSRLDNFSALKYELLYDYDVIYVDWNNGVDYIQNNAELLKKAIQWVNSVKEGTEKNVVLGESMGGLIARYALKDMEDAGINHDTKLFISHDSPHLGANIPIGLQDMLVNVSKTYIKSPIIAGIGEFIVPLFTNGISANDILTLTDTPAARQMLINYVNKNYGIDNSVHNNWQSILKSKGYPQMTRNVAISNGSECGTDQNLSDLLRLYKETNQQHLFSDIIGTILGGFTTRPDMIFLASLPGSSKYVFDFTVRPMTSINENKQIYNGSIKYKKKVLWLINANVSLLSGSKNQPGNILPYDKFGGGRFDLQSDELPSVIASNASINQFSFIPTPSAFDYKFGNSVLTENDFQKPYSRSGDSPNVPFVHFVAEEVGRNNIHTFFSARNTAFIQNQLSASSTQQNEPLETTFKCGDKVKIGGESIICDNIQHTYTVAPAPNTDWIITEGNSLIDIIGGTNNPEIIIKAKSGANGLVILQATLSDYTGSNTITKKIWIGAPLFYINQTYTNINRRVSVYLQSANPLASLEDMGMFPYNVSWYRPNNNITKQGGFTYAFTENSFPLDGVPVEATVSNTCGISHQSGNFFPDSANCGGFNIANTGGQSYSVNIINPCPPTPLDPTYPSNNNYSKNSVSSKNSSNSDLQDVIVKVFNSMGMQVLSTSNLQFNLNDQMIGTYYVKIIKNGNVIHTQTLLKN